MDRLLIIALVGSLILCGILGWLFRRLVSPRMRLPVTAGWIDELSVERYRPMMRLLENDDLDFLRGQPGFSSSMASRLRAQRCKIFRGYLRCLSADFARVVMALNLLMLQSRDDRPDLAALLIRQQALFALGMGMVQVRILCYRCGLCGVNVAGLVGIFDGMRLQLQSLVPATMGMEA